ncbi:S8 family peptidase [Granulosicoccus antarcticus]|uniref:Subtilisin E n=1 Tax=Granulosicoccus antarcticus IMCC3135 TaxID=1192854 RepID=A0A2Z2NVI6_9GAMM|nr:S8 family peptidase [Granulosicoccus antarcticus]ASJ73738.1 Subtilisin E [Granulosicoccus antarcticus IMCC3135]
MATTADHSRKPMIVTFKRKNKRSTKSDKQKIMKDVMSSRVEFLTTEDFSRSGRAVASGADLDKVGFDVNRFKAPILMAHLSDAEIDELKKHKDVQRVEEDGIMYALTMSGLNLRNEGAPDVSTQTVPHGISQINAPDAWACSQGEGIKVFICDTGIDSDHPDLVENLKTGKSFVTDESSTEDFNGHGTHCAGTVAAALNNIGVVGVAPHAYLYPVKVLAANGSGNWSWMIAALDWITEKKGARIASMSLGGAGAPQALADMCEAAYDDGVLLVAAAGNAGPADNTVGFPGKYRHVMAVSAVDDTNMIADFSSRGPEVEIAAPGVKVLSTVRGGGYDYSSGTSMACPHVSGAAALAWGSHRGANNKQIRWLLNSFANKIADHDPEKYGNGSVNANGSAFFIGTAEEHEL